MKNNLYIITHCESCFNKRNIFTGRLNSHLTAHGKLAAAKMAEKLKHTPIDLIIHTSLARTKETAKYILEYHPHAEIEIDDRIIERDYGILSGKNKQKYQLDYPKLFPIYHRSYDVAPPGGESLKQVEQRVIPFLQELITRIHQHHLNVLIICHGNSIRPMIRYFEKLSPKQMMQLEHKRHHIHQYQV